MSIRIELGFKEIAPVWIVHYTSGTNLEMLKSTGKIGLNKIYYIKLADGRIWSCVSQDWVVKLEGVKA